MREKRNPSEHFWQLLSFCTHRNFLLMIKLKNRSSMTVAISALYKTKGKRHREGIRRTLMDLAMALILERTLDPSTKDSFFWTKLHSDTYVFGQALFHQSKNTENISSEQGSPLVLCESDSCIQMVRKKIIVSLHKQLD